MLRLPLPLYISWRDNVDNHDRSSENCDRVTKKYECVVCWRERPTFPGQCGNGSGRFRCGIKTIQKTLKATTQRRVCQAVHPLHRRYRVGHLNLNRKWLNDTFYMDTFSSKAKSIAGFTCAQRISNGSFTCVYPMDSKSVANFAAALN